ncbi:BtpA/SgcQ family protein [Thermococcus sp.]|uniref:BtpA/SgcQ family protein n=1 Tax=Thermococcus sp. TaxID=35749 RepID=UPI002623D5F7|nr:BtpA/SgcQ family protein [Thermococcus sp.]
MTHKFQKIFGNKKAVIGMIHLQALPGTPKYDGSTNQIIEKALNEACTYQQAGIDALMIENMHDVPYTKNDVGHEISSLTAIIAYLIKQKTGLPLGIQILAGANKAALATALSAGANFIRAEGFVFGHLADEGYIDSQAAELLRYRKQIGAEHIAIFTDIKKKHSSHALTSDLDIVEMAHAAAFFLSDGLIVTGMHTGDTADLNELKKVKTATNLPVLVGSGVDLDNVTDYMAVTDALIIGSYFKKDGYWANDVDGDKVRALMKKVNSNG